MRLKKFAEISDIWSKASEASVGISAKCSSLATLRAMVSQLQQGLGVGIATGFYRRRYSDGCRPDGKNLGKFPTFGQKRRKQVSEFLPNVVV